MLGPSPDDQPAPSTRRLDAPLGKIGIIDAPATWTLTAEGQAEVAWF